MSLSRRLTRAATRLRDLEALLSLDPRRWAMRLANRQIGRMVGRATRGLYLRRRR